MSTNGAHTGDMIRTALEGMLRQPAGVEAYAWPGGYPIGYLTDDGEYLCGACVNDPTNPVHVGGAADGWRLEGFEALEGSSADYDGAVYCAHCWSVLIPGDDDDGEA